VHVAIYLGLLCDAEHTLASSLRTVADGHAAEADVHHLGHQLARQCDDHAAALAPLVSRYGSQPDDEPQRLAAQGLCEVRDGPVGLLRDLQDLYLLATFVDITWTLLGQAGAAARDTAILDTVAACEQQTATQLGWLRTRLTQAAPQALVGS
jgi:hypothetical protein